uniref:Uncharacterized protein n=1 Tax=Arundo donax TaxID=35708 RepID=A0A0A9BRY7_ARUDO
MHAMNTCYIKLLRTHLSNHQLTPNMR